MGGVRTALFNWLFARHHGGTFILRIDDTDPVRSKPEHLEHIKSSLRWLGLDWDEGPDVGGPHAPYFQSQRGERYAAVAKQLLDGGKAFPCWCSADELEAKRQQAARNKTAPRYDGRCLNLTAADRAKFEAEGRKPALRFRLPEGPALVVDDLIKGRVEYPRETLDHFIIVRSDGKPVYNFVSAIDEVDFCVTHVIRGDDHLANTPKQMLIAESLGFPLPAYAHLPQILGLDRARLSKRHGAPGVLELRDEGFLKEAVLNFLALLGWSYSDKDELFSPAELIEKFDLKRVGSAAAVFDEKKLLWMNGVYMRKDPSLDGALRGRVQAAYPAATDPGYVDQVVALVKEGLKTLNEVVPAVEFFFVESVTWEEGLKTKLAEWPRAKDILEAVTAIVSGAASFTPEALEADFRAKSEAAGFKFKDYVHPTRFALTGRVAGPSLFHLMGVLGKERCLKRLKEAQS